MDLWIINMKNKCETGVIRWYYFHQITFRPNIIVYTTKGAKTGCIPGPGALDGFVGSSSAFVHECHMYVWCACTSAWNLAPQGLIPFYDATYIYIFFNKTP